VSRSTIERRTLGPTDAGVISREIAQAVARGDLRASSDAEGTYVMKSFDADPGQFAGALDADELVGFIIPEFKVTVVRPDRRRQGIGRALVETGVEMERARGRPYVLMGVVPGDAIGIAFLEATGFGYHSTVWDLDLEPGRDVPTPVWPDGHVARFFERDRDLDAWVDVFNETFAHHPTPLQVDLKTISAMLDDPDIAEADVIVVEDVETREIVGFCGVDPQRRGAIVGPHAELWSVGVRPDRQGRGLGRQLVRAGVERARAIGARSIGLAVNGRNESALALYESEGFIRTRTRDRWSRPVDAGEAGT
jgi:mycothiol synthase